MRTQTFTIFDAATRLPVSCVTCNEKALAQHVKDGQIAIPGRHRSQRLNDANEPEHDAARASATDREQLRSGRLAQIEALERKQLRPMRELQVDPGNAEAQRRIVEIDAEIAKLRESLK